MWTLLLAACVAGAAGFFNTEQDVSTLVQMHTVQHSTQRDIAAEETMIKLVFAMRMVPLKPNKPKDGSGFTGPQLWHKDDSGIPVFSTNKAPNQRSSARFAALFMALTDGGKSDFEIHWDGGKHKMTSFTSTANTQYFLTLYVRKTSTMSVSKCSVHFGEDRYQPTLLKTVNCPDMYELFADKFEDLVIVNDHRGGVITLRPEETCDSGTKRLHCIKLISQAMEPDDPSVEVTAPEVHDLCWCTAWGDVHYGCKCDGQKYSKYNYQGLGPHVLISMPKFAAQVFHCPLNSNRVSIQVAFAAVLGPHTISFYEDIKIDDVVYVPDEEDGETILCVLREGSTGVEAYAAVSDTCQARVEIYPKKTAGQRPNTAYSQQMVIVGPIMSQRELVCSVNKRVFKNPARSPTGWVMDINCWFSDQAFSESTGILTAKELAEAPGKGFYAGGFDAGWFLGNYSEQNDMFTKCCDGQGEGEDNLCNVPGPTEPLTLADSCAPRPDCQNVGMLERAEAKCAEASDDPETIAQCALDFCECCECEDFLESCETSDAGEDTEATDLPDLPDDLPEVEDLPTTTTVTTTTVTTTTTTVTTVTTTTTVAPVTTDPNTGAVGDPHCINVRGQGFDVHSQGEVTFVAVPRGRARGRDLVVKAVVEPVNDHPCSPTVITMVKVAGEWLGSAPALALVPGTVEAGVPLMPSAWERWMASEGAKSGNVTLQVKGATPRMNLKLAAHKVQVNVKQRLGEHTGMRFLDLQVKGLKSLGSLAGGILGLDDHTEAEKAVPGCDPHAVVRLDRGESGEQANTGRMISVAAVEDED